MSAEGQAGLGTFVHSWHRATCQAVGPGKRWAPTHPTLGAGVQTVGSGELAFIPALCLVLTGLAAGRRGTWELWAMGGWWMHQQTRPVRKQPEPTIQDPGVLTSPSLGDWWKTPMP